MRILLAIHSAHTDHTSEAAQSMRILMQWMAQAGHEVRVLGTRHLSTARSSVEGVSEVSQEETLKSGAGRPTFEFTLNAVPASIAPVHPAR